jgi:hypothetical protein
VQAQERASGGSGLIPCMHTHTHTHTHTHAYTLMYMGLVQAQEGAPGGSGRVLQAAAGRGFHGLSECAHAPSRSSRSLAAALDVCHQDDVSVHYGVCI